MKHRFADRLKELRAERDLKQRDLEEALKLRPGTVSQYERGLREPGFDLLMDAADFFDTTVDYLLGLPHAPRESYALLEGRRRLAQQAGASPAMPLPRLLRLALELAPDAFALHRVARWVGTPAPALKLWMEGAATLPAGVADKLARHLGAGPQCLNTHASLARSVDSVAWPSTG